MKGPERIDKVLGRMGIAEQAMPQALKEHEARWHCHHKVTQLRRKTDSLGRPQIAHQCQRCGTKVGGWLSQNGLRDILKIEPWDDVIADDYLAGERDERSAIFAQFRDDETRKFWDNYRLYMQTAEWARRRNLVLERAKYVCEGCGTARATQVHHTTYEHFQNELLWELRAVCDECHKKVHPHMRGETAA